MASEIVKSARWAELHPELLDEIAKHIPSPHDYVVLRAVCKWWNTALPKISRHIRGPLLVLPLNDETLKTVKKEAYHLRLPQLQDTQIRGSCFGWLITVGIGGELRIFNPFTSSYFLLPPLSTFPGVTKYDEPNHGYEYHVGHQYGFDAFSDRYFSRIRMQKRYIVKIVLSSSPEEEDFMAVAICGECTQLAFCRSGDDKWTDLDFPIKKRTYHFGLQDVIFHKGKIYAVDGNAYFYEVDIKTLPCGVSNVRQPRHSNPNKNYLVLDADGHPLMVRKWHNKYLVRNHDGHLVMAVRHFHFEYESKVCRYKTSGFDIFKLDESTKRWHREFSLGDYVLVVGYNSSIWIPHFQDEEGNWVRNCIYYTDNLLRRLPFVYRGQDIGIFNLEDGSINRLFPNSDFFCSPVWLWDSL